MYTDGQHGSATCHDDGFSEAQQHERQGTSCVGHSVCAMHHQEGVMLLPVLVQQLGQLHPLLRADPGAVLVEGHFQVQIGKFIQLWDDVQQIVQHVTCRYMMLLHVHCVAPHCTSVSVFVCIFTWQ